MDGQRDPNDTAGGAGATGLRAVLAYNQHGGYCVPASSMWRPAAKRVVEGEVWEPDTLAFMAEHCGRRDIVHAGTFFGDFLPALSHAVADDAIVWAFEPGRENYRCARITVELNELSNVRLVHAGLGSASESALVRTHDARGRSLGGGSKIVDDARRGVTERVGIVALDDVVPRDREVGIVQLDVEGYEQQALSGALATIRRCSPALIIEELPRDPFLTSEWFRRTILDLGYRRHATIHSNAVFVPASTGSRHTPRVKRVRTVIHIGAEKTGSTALQTCFAESREALAAAGIVYPSTLGASQQSGLALYAMADDRTNVLIDRKPEATSDRVGWRKGLAARLAAEVDPLPGTLLLSSEVMAAQIVSAAEVARLKELLERWSDEYVVVLYMRRQDRATVSLHSTDLRVGSASSEILGPHPFTAMGFDYARILDVWSEVFGSDAMLPRVYESARSGDDGLVGDFLRCSALPISPDALTQGAPVANGALSAKAQALLLEYNRITGEGPAITHEQRAARRAVVAAASQLHPGAPRRPGRDDARAFLARYAEGNARVAQRWFGRSELFDDDFDEYPEQPDPLPEITPAEAMQLTVRVAGRLGGVDLAAKRAERRARSLQRGR